MDEPFLLTVPYKGEQCDFETQLVITGYTYKFRVMINEVEMGLLRESENDHKSHQPLRCELHGKLQRTVQFTKYF